jgi:hypothetical protein
MKKPQRVTVYPAGFDLRDLVRRAAPFVEGLTVHFDRRVVGRCLLLCPFEVLQLGLEFLPGRNGLLQFYGRNLFPQIQGGRPKVKTTPNTVGFRVLVEILHNFRCFVQVKREHPFRQRIERPPVSDLVDVTSSFDFVDDRSAGHAGGFVHRKDCGSLGERSIVRFHGGHVQSPVLNKLKLKNGVPERRRLPFKER